MCSWMQSGATDYVAEFTREIPRAKVLSARAVMIAADKDIGGSAGFADSVLESTKIEDLAQRVVDGDAPVAVVDEAGRVIGQLTREAVLDVLVRRERKP